VRPTSSHTSRVATDIEAAFRIFHGWLTPSGTESTTAQSHRASIESCVRANFGLKRFWRTGSFGNGTSIRGCSDIDYFTVIPAENLTKDSDASLRIVRDVLDRRFPLTGVRVDCPAVRVPFGTARSEAHEIVPAFEASQDARGRPIYGIADCSGGWMRSAPDIHNKYVAEIDERLGGKVRPLIRFIKAWKYFRDVPVSSFYLELRTAAYASGEQTILYSVDVCRVLDLMWRERLAPFTDPTDVSGATKACKSSTAHQDAFSKLETASARADKAREAERQGRIAEAFRWWDQVYADKFQAYG
jgi:hypothetical protein